MVCHSHSKFVNHTLLRDSLIRVYRACHSYCKFVNHNLIVNNYGFNGVVRGYRVDQEPSQYIAMMSR